MHNLLLREMLVLKNLTQKLILFWQFDILDFKLTLESIWPFIADHHPVIVIGKDRAVNMSLPRATILLHTLLSMMLLSPREEHWFH